MIDIVCPNHTINAKKITAYFHDASINDIVMTFLIGCVKLDCSIYLPKQDHDVR